MKRRIFQTQNGFTLVELAIALMVIGLLIGGVLKGQELIENARITATMRQLKAYDAATMIFRNTYGAFPGDIKRPNRIPNCTDELCVTAGNGNGKIGMFGDPNDSRERYNVWTHLMKAGLIQGPEGGTVEDWENIGVSALEITGNTEKISPVMPISTIQLVRVYWLTGVNWHAYDLYTMTARQAYTFDQKLDDGNGTQGDVRMEDTEYCYADEEPYYNLDGGMCGLIIRTGF